MMSVAMLSRYEIEPDFVKEAMSHSHAIRDAAVELGVERMVIGQSIAGPYTGAWIIMTRAADLATLEKLLRTLPENEDFQAMMSSGKMKLVSRGFIDIAEGF